MTKSKFDSRSRWVNLANKAGKNLNLDKLKKLFNLRCQQLNATRALEFAEDLDKIVSVYFRPTGEIAVTGFKENLCRYKVFRDL